MGKLKTALRQALRPILPQVRALRVWPQRRQAQRLAAQLKPTPNLTVCYLTSEFPRRPALRSEFANGGAVKLTFLAETFPHAYPVASLLYTVSSIWHPGQADIVRQAKRRGVKVVLNQNGVAYLAWHGLDWEIPNQKQRQTYLLADFIVYQSEFCRLGAEKFLGQPAAPGRVVYNPVDLNLYQPRTPQKARKAPVLLLGGNQYEQYRFESALAVLQETLKFLPGTQLIVTGKFWGDDPARSLEVAKRQIHALGLTEAVELTGTYLQQAAPEIFQRADILIHTKYNDPSPNLIPEALAAGLPVVYSASGGVPELVSSEAGIGIPVEASWDRISLPNPQAMAAAILTVWESRSQFAAAARQSAEERFALENFVAIHREIFSTLLD